MKHLSASFSLSWRFLNAFPGVIFNSVAQLPSVDVKATYVDELQNLLFKVAEHSFQVPMPNSPLLLNYLRFGVRFFATVKVNHRRIFSRILARVCAVAMATELVKNKA